MSDETKPAAVPPELMKKVEAYEALRQRGLLFEEIRFLWEVAPDEHLSADPVNES